MYIADYHLHTKISPDSKATLDEMCKAALKAGLSEIAVTDHFECNGWNGSNDTSYYDEKFSLDEINRSRKQYQDQLKIIHGVELGQATQELQLAEGLLARNDFDFILASMHNIRGKEDFYFLDYIKDDKYLLFDRYLDELVELTKWGQFDVLAHITYPQRYIVGDRKLDFNLTKFEEKIRFLFQKVVESGKGIEINTSGLRQKIGETLPGSYILNLYKQEGGEIITIGSDSHRPSDVGAGIREARDLAKSIGFKYIAVFEKRKIKMILL